jgi:hypothetical protein
MKRPETKLTKKSPHRKRSRPTSGRWVTDLGQVLGLILALILAGAGALNKVLGALPTSSGGTVQQ